MFACTIQSLATVNFEGIFWLLRSASGPIITSLLSDGMALINVRLSPFYK